MTGMCGGGGGGRCFRFGTGLSSRGSIQKNMSARERFGRVLQGLIVQDPTNCAGELLVFVILSSTAPHESACAQLHIPGTQFTLEVLGGQQLRGHEHMASTSSLLPSRGCPPHLELTQFPGTELLSAPLLHTSVSPHSPAQHPTLPYITHPLITPASSPPQPRTSQVCLHPAAPPPPPLAASHPLPFTPSTASWLLLGWRDHKVPGVHTPPQNRVLPQDLGA